MNKTINVIITWSTGMVGEGVLHTCLNSSYINQVLIINRSPLDLQHPKLTQIIHDDMSDLTAIQDQLQWYDACYFCLGTTSIGKSKEVYEHITYDIAMSYGRTLIQHNPTMTFCYISWQGTDLNSPLHRARVKGKTEQDLSQLWFHNYYSYRPWFIKPMDWMTKTLSLYRYVAWIYPLYQLIAPNGANTLEQIGQSMIYVSIYPYDQHILNGNEIRHTASSLNQQDQNPLAQKSDKAARITFWISTLALALFILPGLFFMHSQMAIDGMAHVWLTWAVWLQQLLGWASPLAILTILIPQIPTRLKEWAYAGLGFVYIGAFWAHLSSDHPMSEVLMPVVTFAVLAVSYVAWHTLVDKK